MISQSEYSRRIAQKTHFPLADLMNRMNRLREGGMLKKGGRGLSAGKISSDEGALILLSPMTGASANTCPDEVRKFSALRDEKGIDLGGALTEILEEPVKADLLKSFMVDHINNYAVLTWIDGTENFFGKKVDANSGAMSWVSGRVFRDLGLAMLPRKKGSPAHFKWVKEVVKIGREQGEEAADQWMRENPFIEE